jgi:hypothetical protein
VSEWSKEHDWKSCIRDERIEGSNPFLSATNMESYPRGRRGRFAKPLEWATAARVRIPHSPPFAPVAQSVERIHGKDEVAGSIPVGSTSLQNNIYGGVAQLARAYGSYP